MKVTTPTQINKKEKSISVFIALILASLALLPILAMTFSSITVSRNLLIERNKAAQVSAGEALIGMKEEIFDATEDKIDELIQLETFQNNSSNKAMKDTLIAAATGDTNVLDIIYMTETGKSVSAFDSDIRDKELLSNWSIPVFNDKDSFFRARAVLSSDGTNYLKRLLKLFKRKMAHGVRLQSISLTKMSII